MSLRAFVVILFLFAVQFAFAKTSCKTDGHVLKIACTMDCPEPYKQALNDAAAQLGYKIEIGIVSKPADLDGVDAFLSPGGHDIDPKYYSANLNTDEKKKISGLYKRLGNSGKEESPAQAARDERESKILKRYFDDPAYANLPYLGVCYGMQMLASSRGLPLTVDIQEQLGIPPRRKLQDKIDLQSKSVISGYLDGATKTIGAKSHHQSVDMAYWNANASKFADVNITGTSHEGKIAEVLEVKSRPALGIQFHAERTEGDPKARLAPYTWFLEKACQRKTHVKKTEGPAGGTNPKGQG